MVNPAHQISIQEDRYGRFRKIPELLKQINQRQSEQFEKKLHKCNRVTQNKHASAKEQKGEKEVKQVQVKVMAREGEREGEEVRRLNNRG